MAGAGAVTGSSLPCSPEALDAARAATLAAMGATDPAAGFIAAMGAMAGLDRDAAASVAAVLALHIGRPGLLAWTAAEWPAAAEELGMDP